MNPIYYKIVLYKNDKMLPLPFNTRKEADDFIFAHKLHAYITMIKEGE